MMKQSSLSLEKFKSSMVSNDIYLITYEFVLPLEEGFKYGNHFHLKYSIVVLSRSKLLGHKACQMVGLP
jgi:hypothetical protein